MLLFQSEEDINVWIKRTGEPRGEALSLAQVWDLARHWYGNRMDAGYRGRTSEQVQAVFEAAGLMSDFWRVE